MDNNETEIKYKEDTIRDIEAYTCSAWMVEFENGEKELHVWHSQAKIEDIIQSIKILRKIEFTVHNVDTGEFQISTVIHSYCHDARRVNQNLIVSVDF